MCNCFHTVSTLASKRSILEQRKNGFEIGVDILSVITIGTVTLDINNESTKRSFNRIDIRLLPSKMRVIRIFNWNDKLELKKKNNNNNNKLLPD